VLLKICGAELDVITDDLCPTPGASDGSINLAKSHAKAQPDKYVMPNQYENEQNALVHYRTTGPEIWSQTEGRIKHLFVSLGTCGTVTGCARFLKEKNPNVKIVAVQPTEGHDVPGLRNVSQLEVSKLYDPSLIDDLLEIDFELAYQRALDLARGEGLLAGPSSGLVFEGATRIIERDRDGVGVMIFADDVFKYVSSMIRHIPELAEGTSA
jgi:cysteine synthase B